MKFSFDECEIINNLIEEIGTINQEEMIKKIDTTKENTEDLELINICRNIVSKIEVMNEEKFNYFILNLPVETLSNY